MMQRLTKIAMCSAMGVYATIVAYDNVVDYGTNYAFLQHVLGMDTTLPGTALRSRAIADPTMLRLVYGCIIAAEALIGALYLVAAAALCLACRASAQRFEAAKGWVYAASTAGFLLWFGGFEIIGGEWFAMWQSPHWNGQQAAFRFYVTILVVLLFVSRPETETRHEGA